MTDKFLNDSYVNVHSLPETVMIIEDDREYRKAQVEVRILEHVPLDSPEGDRLIELIEALQVYEEDVLGLYY